MGVALTAVRRVSTIVYCSRRGIRGLVGGGGGGGRGWGENCAGVR
jgi:hypothetical protein